MLLLHPHGEARCHGAFDHDEGIVWGGIFKENQALFDLAQIHTAIMKGCGDTDEDDIAVFAEVGFVMVGAADKGLNVVDVDGEAFLLENFGNGVSNNAKTNNTDIHKNHSKNNNFIRKLKFTIEAF